MGVLLTFLGVLGLVIYGSNRRINISHLTYAIQQARVKDNQLAMLVVVANPLTNTYTQDFINLTLYLDQDQVTNISQADPVLLQPASFTKQGWIVDLNQAGISCAGVQQVRLLGQVSINQVVSPIDLKYRLI